MALHNTDRPARVLIPPVRVRVHVRVHVRVRPVRVLVCNACV